MNGRQGVFLTLGYHNVINTFTEGDELLSHKFVNLYAQTMDRLTELKLAPSDSDLLSQIQHKLDEGSEELSNFKPLDGVVELDGIKSVECLKLAPQKQSPELVIAQLKLVDRFRMRINSDGGLRAIDLSHTKFSAALV